MSTIFVRATSEAFHCWPGAPDHRAYLRQLHRHLFHVEVAMPVGHDDREVEFHDLLDELRPLLPSGDMGHQSCEHMAEAISTELARRYARSVAVTVSEDGECGATVTTKFAPSQSSQP